MNWTTFLTFITQVGLDGAIVEVSAPYTGENLMDYRPKVIIESDEDGDLCVIRDVGFTADPDALTKNAYFCTPGESETVGYWTEQLSDFKAPKWLTREETLHVLFTSDFEIVEPLELHSMIAFFGRGVLTWEDVNFHRARSPGSEIN